MQIYLITSSNILRNLVFHLSPFKLVYLSLIAGHWLVAQLSSSSHIPVALLPTNLAQHAYASGHHGRPVSPKTGNPITGLPGLAFYCQTWHCLMQFGIRTYFYNAKPNLALFWHYFIRFNTPLCIMIITQKRNVYKTRSILDRWSWLQKLFRWKLLQRTCRYCIDSELFCQLATL